MAVIRSRPKTQAEINREWDEIAEARAAQLYQGKDLSYSFVLVPCVLSLCLEKDYRNVLDVGCGSGSLAAHLACSASHVVGVDPSRQNIRIAKEHYPETPRLEFVNSTIEEYASDCPGARFTLAVANMSLMTVLDLDSVLSSIAGLLVPDAQFVFTITHPCFWPLYWGYANAEWYEYRDELLVEAPFKISLDRELQTITTHVHRPLARYVSSLLQAGFIIDSMLEPMPTETVEARYPTEWQYPRFLVVRCIRHANREA